MPANASAAVQYFYRSARTSKPDEAVDESGEVLYTARVVIRERKGEEVRDLYEWEEVLPGAIADVNALKTVGIEVFHVRERHYLAIVEGEITTDADGYRLDDVPVARYVVDHTQERGFFAVLAVDLAKQPYLTNAVSGMTTIDLQKNVWKLTLTSSFMAELSLYA